MNSLYEIEKQILNSTTSSDRIVKGIWSVDCLYNPAGNGRIFDYKFLVSQTIGQGAAYSIHNNYPRDLLKNIVGMDFTELSIEDIALKTCLLDSLYGIVCPADKKQRMVFNGSSFEKLQWRTNIIVNEAKRLIGSLNGKRIVNVGVVGDILRGFSEEKADVVGTDYDESLVGSKFFGKVPIFDGSNTPSIVKGSDLAVVTGMTITSGTIDEILKVARESNVKIIVFAETGANLAGYYLKNGVHSYLSECFPFYIFNGQSIIDVCTC